MVNTEVVQRKIVFLPGEIYLPKLPNGSGGTEPAKVRVNRVVFPQCFPNDWHEYAANIYCIPSFCTLRLVDHL